MLEAVGCQHYEHLAYPAVDLLRASTLSKLALDVVILDEILEHLPNPFLAAANLRRALRPGGVVPYDYRVGPAGASSPSP